MDLSDAAPDRRGGTHEAPAVEGLLDLEERTVASSRYTRARRHVSRTAPPYRLGMPRLVWRATRGAGAAGLVMISVAVGLDFGLSNQTRAPHEPARGRPPGPVRPRTPRTGSSACSLLSTTTGDVAGQAVHGISCDLSEQFLFHAHTYRTIFVEGIGILASRTARHTTAGPFVIAGSCFSWTSRSRTVATASPGGRRTRRRGPRRRAPPLRPARRSGPG